MVGVRVAAAQIAVGDDSKENLRTILSHIALAAQDGASIICFPETCLINDKSLVRPIGHDVHKIRDAARRHRVVIIFGTYVKEDGRLRNQIWVIDRDGRVIHRYSKRHPYITETRFIKIGRKNKVLRVDGVPFAVINCWDYAFPEQIRRLAKRGATIIFCPSYLMSFPRTSDVLVKVPQVRAFDAMAYFVMVDAYAPDTFQHTRICHPLREIASIEGRQGIVYADLELDQVAELRKTFDNMEDVDVR